MFIDARTKKPATMSSVFPNKPQTAKADADEKSAVANMRKLIGTRDDSPSSPAEAPSMVANMRKLLDRGA